jgi:hypothetical protein
MTRNGERRSIASPTTISLFFNVVGLDIKSLLTQKFLQKVYTVKKIITIRTYKGCTPFQETKIHEY